MQHTKVYSISLGCPKNRVDTERLLACFGPELMACDSPQQADVVLINTCGFIAPAIEESVKVIMDMVDEIAETDPKPLLAVVGCLVGRFHQELMQEIPEVDLWLPVLDLKQWPELIAKALERPLADQGLRARTLSTGPSFAYLKVAEGCDHNCAFCTIPSIRGGLKSLPLKQVVDEARTMLDQGVSELVLVAQDLTSWGRDLSVDNALQALFEALVPLDGLKWLRPMYLYPGGLSDKTLDFMARTGRPLLPYFDVPLQHAHPDILKSMGRPFARDPRLTIDRIRRHLPDAALRTSLIVGYPGETDEHFQALKAFVKEARFHHLGVFGYCDEEGTAAHALGGKVPQEVIEQRRQEIMALQATISENLLVDFEGTTQYVLVDAEHPEWPGLHVGRCWFQAPEADGVTYISGQGVTPGAMVRARIDEAKTYDLVALAD